MDKKTIAKKLIKDRIINCMEWYMSNTLIEDIIGVMEEYADEVNKNESISNVIVCSCDSCNRDNRKLDKKYGYFCIHCGELQQE